MSKLTPKQKHVPMRMCIVSREKLPKSKLVRIVKLPTGVIEIEQTKKLKGRGANIKMDIDLFSQALDKGILQRALKINKNMEASTRENLIEEFKNVVDMRSFREANKPVTIRVKKEKINSL